MSQATAFAMGSNGNSSTLVQKIADKFHINTSDVQAVFDQERSERQAEMQVKFEERLTQLVKDGKITNAQKQLIIAKHKELQATRQANGSAWQNMSSEERRVQMQAEKQALDDWAKQNGIDHSYLFGGMGMRGHGFGR